MLQAAGHGGPAVASGVTISQLSSSYGQSLSIFMTDLKVFIDTCHISPSDKAHLLHCIHEVTNLMTCFEKAYQVYKTTWSAITTFDPLLLKETLITHTEDDYQLSVYESLWKLFAAFIYSECSVEHHQPDKFLAILIQIVLFMSSYISTSIMRPPRECTFLFFIYFF